MISYGEILWGNLMGMSYGAFLSVFNELSLAGQAWLGRAVLGRPVLVWAGLGWHGMSWACKVQLKIPIRNHHNESPHNWNLAKYSQTIKIMVRYVEYHGLFLWGFLIVLCTISLLYKIWLKIPIRGPQYVNKFLVRHKNFGPAQNMLGPVKGQGIS